VAFEDLRDERSSQSRLAGREPVDRRADLIVGKVCAQTQQRRNATTV
jgi:hypothetical protein